MINRFFLSAFLSCLLLTCSVSFGQLVNDLSDQVAMRMIGHRVMQKLGDSTSKVLPIEANGPLGYKISFESEFDFDPAEMVATINDAVIETKVAESYVVEVVSCIDKDSMAVVYSYLVDSTTQKDIAPCGGRVMGKRCYSILFTIIKGHEDGAIAQPISDQSAGGNTPESTNYSYILLVIMVLIGLAVVWRWRGVKQEQTNEDVLALGKYRFDYRNMVLSFENEKMELSSKEADLLKLLIDKANTALKREVLLKEVWGDDGDYIGRTLDVFISKLRKKLEHDDQLRIANVRGVGYKLILNG